MGRNILLSTPTIIHFLVALVIVSIGVASINMGYYFLWDLNSTIPIPDPYTLEYVGYQSIFIALVNGLIHYGFRNKTKLSSFEYLKWILILVLANAAICYVAMNIQIMPSINEVKRLYGASGKVPSALFSLSIPIALLSSISGMFAIPYFLWRNKRDPNQKFRYLFSTVAKCHPKK